MVARAAKELIVLISGLISFGWRFRISRWMMISAVAWEGLDIVWELLVLRLKLSMVSFNVPAQEDHIEMALFLNWLDNEKDLIVGDKERLLKRGKVTRETAELIAAQYIPMRAQLTLAEFQETVRPA